MLLYYITFDAGLSARL